MVHRAGRERKTDVQLVHSLVSTCNVIVENMGASAEVEWIEDRNRTLETFVMPPRRVFSTAHHIVGTALIKNLEQFVFGMPIRDWVTAMAGHVRTPSYRFVKDARDSSKAINHTVHPGTQ